MPHAPTDEQSAIISSMRSPESVMIKSYAGTAKTTTLQMASPEIKTPALALAFNRKITAELAGVLPPNFTVKSLNSLGHAAWQRVTPARLQLDDRKLGKLITELAKSRNMKLTSDQWDSTRRLVSGAMQVGIVPGNAGTPLVPDEIEAWREIWDVNDLVEDDFPYCFDLAHQVLEESNARAKQGLISYDDQIYCSVCLGGKFPQFPVIFADEFQDFSPLNHRMVDRALRPDGKLVLAGDPLQSIYAFRGADSNSMTNGRSLRPEWIDRTLTLTFRCPKVIVERQQIHAPGYRAWHANAEGLFREFPRMPEEHGRGSWSLDVLDSLQWDISNVFESHPLGQRASLAILCRNNAPLLSLAFKLLRRGIGVQMLGRDIGKNLIALSRKLIPDDSTPSASCAVLITEWSERECSLARANDKTSRIESILDRAECLYAVILSANVRHAGELRAALERLFEQPTALITLSSIHRAKGMEWDIVLHLDPWRLPSKFAITPTEIQQECNLQYVCETRTRHTLIEASLKDFR